MRKRKPKVIIVRVAGRLDSLTDILKKVLFEHQKQTVDELLPLVQQRFVGGYSMTKLEKNLRRCLGKNPAFRQFDEKWSLDFNGQPSNDQVYQRLHSRGKPASLVELRELKQLVAEVAEKDLVQDGRFLRCSDGKWALIHWDVFWELNENDLQRVARELQQAGKPLTAMDLAGKVLRSGVMGNDLVSHLQGDKRFVAVGHGRWYLSTHLPIFARRELAANHPQEKLYRSEKEALQEAELVLILHDTNPDIRSYLVASEDLELGIIRVNSRLEKMFNNLPALAFTMLATREGPVEVWYSREQQVLWGLGNWFRRSGMEPGARLELRRNGSESAVQLVATGDRVEEVHQLGKRILQLETLRNQRSGLAPQELLTRLLQLFPGGLEEKRLLATLEYLRPAENQDFGALLREVPYFEQASGEVWRVNMAAKVAYEQVQSEVQEVRRQLDSAQREAAATLQEAQSVRIQRDEMEQELLYLENHFKEEENLYRQQVRDLRSENERLRQENSQLKKELEKIHRRKEQLRFELNQREEQVAVMQSEREELKARVQQLETRLVQLQGSLSKTVNNARGEQAGLKQKLNELENQLDSMVIANQRQQRTLEEAQRERLELKRVQSQWLVRLVVSLSNLFGEKEGAAKNRQGRRARPVNYGTGSNKNERFK